MTTPLLSKTKQLAVEIETTAGTAETIVVGDCIYAMDQTLTLDQGKEDINPVLTGLGKAKPVFGGRSGTFEFTQFLKGSGTAGTAPELSDTLQMAGFTHTNVASVRDLYKLESTRANMKTATIKEFKGEVGAGSGIYKTLRGCMAGATFTVKPRMVGKVAFSGMGGYEARGDVTMPQPTFETTNPPTVGSMTGRILKYHSVRVTGVDGAVEKLNDGAASNVNLAITISNGTTEVKIPRIQFHATKVGTPANETNGVWVQIEGDAAGDPDGSAITNGTSAYIATTEFDTTGEMVSFIFATPPTLSASTVYHAVLYSDYDTDTDNCISFDTEVVAVGSQLCQFYDASWDALSLKNLTCNIMVQYGTELAIYLDGFVLETGANVTLQADWNPTDGVSHAEINSFPDFKITVDPLTTLEAVRLWETELRAGTLLYFCATLGSTAGNIVDFECNNLYVDDDVADVDREDRLAETITLMCDRPDNNLTINFR